MVAILKEWNAASAGEKGASRLRGLLQAISQTKAPAGDQGLARYGRDHSEQILLDADFDGDRYLLIRIPLAQPARLSLSPREQEIVRMIARGHSNKRIAMLLNLSLWTIGTHVRRIFAKLGVNSRAAMVARLMEAGAGGNLSLGAQSAVLREIDNGPPFASVSARPRAQPQMVAALAVLPESRDCAAGARLTSTATNAISAAYRNWAGEGDGTQQIGRTFTGKRQRAQ